MGIFSSYQLCRSDVWFCLIEQYPKDLAQIIMDYYDNNLKNEHELRVNCWRNMLESHSARKIHKIEMKLYREVRDCGCHERIY